jgi:hypothetical protein
MNPRPPRQWEGSRAFLLGGGGSLDRFSPLDLAAKGKIVAINRSFERAPFADLLYWADSRFYRWFKPAIDAFPGEKMTGSHDGEYPADVRRVRWDRSAPFSADPAAVAGQCSGAHALNLAALLGAREIWLLGYDFDAGWWHDGYPMDSRPHLRMQKFVPAIEAMAPHLAASGIAVFNANPASNLRCFPFRDPAEIQ